MVGRVWAGAGWVGGGGDGYSSAYNLSKWGSHVSMKYDSFSSKCRKPSGNGHCSLNPNFFVSTCSRFGNISMFLNHS